jgi:hypothetical protein
MPPNPPIRIFFHGLIVLSSPDGISCVGETHRVPGPPHTLSVEVRVKAPGQPDVILMRHFGNLPGTHPGLSIRVTNATSQPAAYKYVPSPRFNPINPTGDEQDDDFRWVINLEGSNFHGRPLSVDTHKTRPGILIEGGVCYFYTALLRQGSIGVTQGGANRPPLQGLAAIIGANLYLDNGSEAVVTCHAAGGDFVLPLGAPGGGVSYEIYIDNSPLFEDASSGHTHSELKEYYGVIQGVPSGEQFNLVFPNLAPDLQREGGEVRGSLKFNNVGSARIPCQSITLDGNG